MDVHGEADLVASFAPASVLDAGCGSGRVAIELARRGIDVVGADVDASMLATAARRAPELSWRHVDLVDLDLGRTFDVVVMAGNVPLFTAPGTQAALVAGVGRHVAAGGHLVAGFSLGRGYELADYDADCRGGRPASSPSGGRPGTARSGPRVGVCGVGARSDITVIIGVGLATPITLALALVCSAATRLPALALERLGS